MTASRLESIFTDVGAVVVEQYGSPLPYRRVWDEYGHRETHNLSNVAPVVIWERNDSGFGPPRASGEDAERPRRELLTRTANILMHVWGRSPDEAENMIDTEVAALAGSCQASWRIGKETPGAANEAWLAHGYAMVVALQIDSPVLDFAPTTARPTAWSFGSATSTPGDGTLEAGEP